MCCVNGYKFHTYRGHVSACRCNHGWHRISKLSPSVLWCYFLFTAGSLGWNVDLIWWPELGVTTEIGGGVNYVTCTFYRLASCTVAACPRPVRCTHTFHEKFWLLKVFCLSHSSHDGMTWHRQASKNRITKEPDNGGGHDDATLSMLIPARKAVFLHPFKLQDIMLLQLGGMLKARPWSSRIWIHTMGRYEHFAKHLDIMCD